MGERSDIQHEKTSQMRSSSSGSGASGSGKRANLKQMQYFLINRTQLRFEIS
jgi:hypothetical protein